jgi:hypothetical protein
MSEIRQPWPNHYPSVEQEAMSRDLLFWLRIGPICWEGFYSADYDFMFSKYEGWINAATESPHEKTQS